MIKTILNILCPAMNLAKGLNVAAATVGASAIGAIGNAISSSNQADAAASAAANSNAPWSAAQPFVQHGFQPAQDALDAALKQGAYTGERVAGLNPYQTQGADQSAAWANGNGQATANQFYNTGMGMSNAGSNYGSNAQSLLTAAQQDPTQGFLSTASQYANNPYVDQMIDAANRDVSRDLNETQLPSLALNAAGSGNTDSTRTGVTQAILQRNASQQMADTASNIRSQFFNNGLTMAQNQYNANQNRALGANQQVGNAFQLGNSALLNGQQANGNNFDQLNAAGSLYQNQQQNVDTANQQQFYDQENVPLNLIGNYESVINGKWGGAPVSSVGPSVAGGAIQGAAGGGMLGYGIQQKLGGYMNGSNSSYGAMGSMGYSVPSNTGSSYYSGGGNTFGFTTG
ncbi:hypothetical protein [Burkholderia sp. Ac-20353]|uniref:hypothetical protein n=1 Tax=Burkholderia sp. Ac-20353 TaxID=2703894 RepID=UPI00197B82CA|nr:hypothetical protein [Burkholderia sp. Ac-20353]MBN3791864.1 hypothetical protein [Burkholderia sp. Ac-20353]